ncbi:hypothetical protein CDD80_101 [Ophiocordyceps camponoti-rufipedis]|uniref:Integral membrane protein n=1 Tax=Ophiocordyceps camponoti-rufipedis TaxID=2004952 RepID=A0A2C5XQA5_9HYPO|nr:hypothetical protein CDD80_101 [Ophiocordyceps camponoti-rufipedis]
MMRETCLPRALRPLVRAYLLGLSRWLASFVASWFSLRLIQSKPSDGQAPRQEAPRDSSAGRTLDLTLFAVTQALDVIIGEVWSRRKGRRVATGRWNRLDGFISRMTDPLSFIVSCAFIMWAWFYAPESLPTSYRKWITSAAHIDIRLIEALRRCRTGQLRYGVDTGQAPLLGSMCSDYGLPPEWGDPAQSIPFPCDVVHMGRGPSCEYHALVRFVNSWIWSMYTYVPLAAALQLRRPCRKSPLRALTSASRSSAFLATFITLFYYGVCLGRSRLGPRLLGRQVWVRDWLDGGLCVANGCFLCGWSVLLETASRRKDMALFTAPRAMATLLPRRYPLRLQWRERLAFAASTAVVFTCVQENPRRVRGMLGSILSLAMRE